MVIIEDAEYLRQVKYFEADPISPADPFFGFYPVRNLQELAAIIDVV